MTNHDERFRVVLENRYGILQHLAVSPATKPELVEDLDTSRSTVDRAIEDLTDIDCLTTEDRRYTVTMVGALALQEQTRYRSTTQAIRSTGDLLSHLPPDSDLDTRMLEGADVTMAENHAPDQALTPSIDLFERATRMRGLAPVVLRFYPNLITNQLADSALTLEIVAESDVVATLPDLPMMGENSFSDIEGVTLYETDATLPYALWLMKTPSEMYAGIAVYDSGGVAGVLINNTDAAVQWAETQYEQYREDAQSVSVSEI